MARVRCVKVLLIALAAVISASVWGGPSLAQSPPAGVEVLRLYPGVAPGSEGQTQLEVEDGARIRNVTVPTLTVFRPKPGAAGDTAVIIAPGGGFHHLSISSEGYDVARALADHGVTAIVLKYRLNASAAASGAPKDGAASPSPSGAPPPPPANPNASPGARLAMADIDAAVRFVRAHAAAWNIAPNRVGVLGFSAGGVIALQAALSPDADVRPDFAASIYGPMAKDAPVPATAPPLFLAVAADDRLVGPAGILPVFEAWRAAGRSVELHVFDLGGHGFGMTRQSTTSDHWIDDYLWWLREKGLVNDEPGR